MQSKHPEWHEQWSIFKDTELFLFKDWIAPYDLTFFEGKTVLEAGCGGGQHTSFMAPYARSITAVDLNTVEIAEARNAGAENIEFVTADIANMDLGKTFDVVISIGVVHHTDDTRRTVENLKRHLAPGGTLILWVYSEEGNWLAKNVVERFRKLFLSNASPQKLLLLSRLITAAMYLPIYTVYMLPVSFLPYYAYFQNFRKMSFIRNVQNVYDKLNAPQTEFISQTKARQFVEDLGECAIIPYRNVSYSISGKKITV